MTSIEISVRNRLLAHSGVAALVGTRITPQPLPQNSPLPAITYVVISRITDARPVDGSNRGIARPRIQIDCWATTQLAAAALEEQVGDALDGYRGFVGDRELIGTFLQNIRDQYEPDTKIHRRMADYFVSAAA